jgi:hypothetical protein
MEAVEWSKNIFKKQCLFKNYYISYQNCLNVQCNTGNTGASTTKHFAAVSNTPVYIIGSFWGFLGTHQK